MPNPADIELRRELMSLLLAVNEQIAGVVTEGLRDNIDPLQMRYSDGRWVLADMHLAKSNTLLALTMLAQKE